MSTDTSADPPTDRPRADVPASEPRTGEREEHEEREKREDPNDLTEMLQELRVLIPGVQVLTGFLLTLPCSQNFRGITLAEKWVFLAAFVLGLISLIMLSAPAAQHRLERPLRDRASFTVYTTRMTIIGLIPLSLALILTAQLVVEHTFGLTVALAVTSCVAMVLSAVWWIWPLSRAARRLRTDAARGARPQLCSPANR